MGLKFTDILFIIVVLFIAGYGVFYYLRAQRNKEIAELEGRKEDMMAISIADQLFTLKNMELSGLTKRKYESLMAQWQTITNFKFTEIEAALVNAEQLSEQMNLVKSKKTIESAAVLLDETEVQVNELYEELSDLIDVSERNRERNEKYLERYNSARQSIMNHSFDYGPAIETLEKNLQYLELNFTKFNELTTEGDHIEAEDMLDTIDADLATLEEILEKIPKMYQVIKNDYEAALDDLRQGYESMLASDYKFDSDDLDQEIDEIQEYLTKAKANIKNADLVDAQTLMDKADRDINSLYDYFEAEVEAHNYVVTHLDRIADEIARVSENNRYVANEVDRISQSYILHHDETTRIHQLQGQLATLSQQLEAIEEQVKSHELVYTSTADVMNKMLKRLEEIDRQQEEIIQDLADLNQREKEAKRNLDLYELDLRNMKRQLEKHHLPGLHENYYLQFYKATDMIEHFAEELNKVRIDMDEIEQLEQTLLDNLNKLEELTEETLDSATLTEYMIQHGNRFRFDYPEMDQAIRRAEYLFYEEYRYHEALAEIEKSLRRVDPDGPTQVRRMYHHEKQHRIY